MAAEKKDYKDLTPEERLERAQKPGKDAMAMHPYYGGKIEVVPKACVRDFNDFAIWYSPGVAEPCKDIAANHIFPDKAVEAIPLGEEKYFVDYNKKGPDTTFMFCADEAGNIVAVTHSINHFFGSGMMFKSWR